MTAQERESLNAFLRQMPQAQVENKDTEADALIRAALTRQPDAAYLLVQRAMGLDYALQVALSQAAKLQTELDQLRSTSKSSFLDSTNAWGRPIPAAGAANAPLASTVSQIAAQPAPASAPAKSWGSGILGAVATTAVGVVAGSFLYQGIQGLMGHQNQSANAATNANSPSIEPEKLAYDSDERNESLEESRDYDYAANEDSDLGDFS